MAGAKKSGWFGALWPSNVPARAPLDARSDGERNAPGTTRRNRERRLLWFKRVERWPPRSAPTLAPNGVDVPGHTASRDAGDAGDIDTQADGPKANNRARKSVGDAIAAAWPAWGQRHALERSSLLRRLAALDQPLVICREDSIDALYLVCLDDHVFCHAELPMGSRSFAIDPRRTDDSIVVVHGQTMTRGRWEVQITRSPLSSSASAAAATGDVASDPDDHDGFRARAPSDASDIAAPHDNVAQGSAQRTRVVEHYVATVIVDGAVMCRDRHLCGATR